MTSPRVVTNALAAVAIVMFAGCAGAEQTPPPAEGPPGPGAERRPPDRDGGPKDGRERRAANPDERVIRGWSRAVSMGDFGRAADHFARGAIVEQDVAFALTSRDLAVAWNASLPCRSSVSSVRDEGLTSLAFFRLRPGIDGSCAEGGFARVRFLIRRGKIREWRQLPQRRGPEPEEIAAAPLAARA